MKRNDNDEEARKQWDWLNIVLQKCQNNKETVSKPNSQYISFTKDNIQYFFY